MNEKESFLAFLNANVMASDIKEFAFAVLRNMPAYFWSVPASSTGKYHPEYALGEGGLARHSLACAEFMKHLLSIEQYADCFTDRQKELLLVAALVHDGRKSGTQESYEKSKYTKFNHPLLMADAVREHKDMCLLPRGDEIEFVASAIEAHMGQWNTDKKSSVVLPKPKTEAQKLLHLSDYLASRKNLFVFSTD